MSGKVVRVAVGPGGVEDAADAPAAMATEAMESRAKT
jgi:hypothetical protein